MAENKKSFMFYRDWKETFDALPNEKAGELIKFILAYVSDENPTTDDFVINAVFANIKNQLKRDLVSYEQKIQKNTINGKKGGRPIKNPTASTAEISEEIESENNPNKPKITQNNPTVNLETQPYPKKPDTDTDTDTDTDIVTSTNVEVEKRSEIKIDTDNYNFKNKLVDIDILHVNYLENKKVVDAVISNSKNKLKNETELKKRLADFVKHQKESGVLIKTMADFSSHFRFWHLKQKDKVEEVVKVTNKIPIG